MGFKPSFEGRSVCGFEMVMMAEVSGWSRVSGFYEVFILLVAVQLLVKIGE